MFDWPRYLTSGVQAEVPIEIQVLLWMLIDDLEDKDGFQIDYLQVFELRAINEGEYNQLIVHHQEVPEYREEYRITVSSPLTVKVWVIDSTDYCTMLLPSEY